MVGPTQTVDEEATTRRRIKVGMAVLVGLSGGLIALQADPTPLQLGAAVLGSFVLGIVLTVYISRILADAQPEGLRERNERRREMERRREESERRRE